jgi:cullin 1
LKKELDSLVEYAFDNHILFQDTKNKAFSYFMSKEQYPKHLANFCDYEMKQGIKGQNESQIEEKLNNIINIFKCLNNKLIFQIEYAKKLSDRLLAGRSQSILAEKSLIGKLKAEAGVTYVSRMTTMLQDLDLSKNIMDLFRSKPHRVII